MTSTRGGPPKFGARYGADLDAGPLREEVAQPDLRRLIHELEVHQHELEMQNEELRAARVEIEDGLARYSELFEFAPIGYVVVSSEGVIRAINLAGARMLAIDKRRLVGVSFLRCVEPQQHGELLAFLKRTLAQPRSEESSETCELKLSGRARGALQVRLTGARVDGRAPDAMIAIEDMTAQKRAEAALREEIARKDEFMAVLSHELRNPLAAIDGGLTLLELGEPGDERASKALAILRRQVTHLTRMVDDLLDVARIARSRIALQREILPMDEIVTSTVDDHRASFEAAGVELSVRCDGKRPWVNADRTRMVQVLGNLLANALKFTPRAGRVDVVLRGADGRATLSVRDTGLGIAKEVCEHLFEPFIQAPQKLDRTRGGLGLGLTMVKELMRLHGGSAQASSPGVGRGAEFTVWLPLVPAPVQPPAPQPVPDARVARRFLVIEDNKDSAETLRALLALQGHEVDVALDGATGVELARSTLPDVILCDLGLPGMDGYGVARAIRAEHSLKHAYLVALSGYARPEDRQRTAQAGFDFHIAKPATLMQLRELSVRCSES